MVLCSSEACARKHPGAAHWVRSISRGLATSLRFMSAWSLPTHLNLRHTLFAAWKDFSPYLAPLFQGCSTRRSHRLWLERVGPLHRLHVGPRGDSCPGLLLPEAPVACHALQVGYRVFRRRPCLGSLRLGLQYPQPGSVVLHHFPLNTWFWLL